MDRRVNAWRCKIIKFKEINYDRLQKADQQQNDHCRYVKHSDRWNEPSKGQQDRIGNALHETEERAPVEYEPRRNKPDEDEQNKQTQYPVKNKTDEDVWITICYTAGQPIDYEKRIFND